MNENEFKWEATIHLFKDKTILFQLLFAIGFPFSIVIGFLIFVSFTSDSAFKYNGLIMIGLLFLLTFLFIGFFYKNKMQVVYEMTPKHIIMKMSPRQTKKNQWVNATLAILSFFNRNATTMGIALISSTNQQQKLRLDHISKANGYPDKYKIVLYDNYRCFLLQCNQTNYVNVKNFLQQYTNINLKN